ncbi:MAG: efflux RND transporter periplasmic adaptor subunit [Candidatus Paceibacterota bacterium]
MKNFFLKIKAFAIAHKIISIIIIIAVLYGGYSIYIKITSSAGETQYITTKVQKGTIISSITASGQVESSSQIDLIAKVSGTITHVGVKAGDKVTKGKTLFSIDNSDAEKTIRDAKISLQSANLSLQKLQIQNSNDNTNASLTKVYVDGFNTVSTTFLDLPSTLNGIQNLLAQGTLSDNAARNSGKTAIDYRTTAETAYYTAQTAYDKNKNDFNTLDYNSKQSEIDALISKTYDTTQLLSNAIKDLNNYVNYLAENTGRSSDFTSAQSTLSGYTNTINGHSSALLTAKENIQSYKDSIPSNDIDMQNALITVTQKQNALADAQQALADYYVSAPFDGTIASVSAKVGDTASGTLGSIITNKKIATLSMNEVDVAKIKLGQKATITFDAIENLSMTGSVAEIDTMGTVSSGVVSYSIKIAFDTENDQIKPGMSVSASIITDSKTNTLMIPSSAIKTQGTVKYVLMFATPLPAPSTGSQGTPSSIAPNQVTVEIGVSDDTNTEIISGLKEGDQVVSRTVTSTSTTKNSTTSTKSLLGGGGPPGM